MCACWEGIRGNTRVVGCLEHRVLVVAQRAVPIPISEKLATTAKQNIVSGPSQCSVASTVFVYGERGGIITHPNRFEFSQHWGHLLDTE